MRIASTAVAKLLFIGANAQTNWVDAGMPELQVLVYSITSLPVDTISGSLYVCGYLQLEPGQHTVLRYSQGQWDTLGIFDQAVKTAVRWQDTLIVGGGFTAVDGVAVDRVACYTNGQWLPYGNISNGTVNKLRVLDNELFLAGGFDYADGHYCNGVAKRVGNQWVNLGFIPGLPSNTLIQDLSYYQGELYACGPLTLDDGTNDIMRFNGTDWIAVGPGVLGGFSGLKAMAVYNGELYAAGSVQVTEGNAGHGIMRWDGTQWHEVGGHLQDAYCGYSFSAPVYDMVVHDDKLFVAGGFGCAGGVPAQRLAIWDGTRWCGLGTFFPTSETTTSVTFLQDTLFVAVGAGDTIDGIPVNGVAKWIGGAYADTCSAPVGISDPTTMDDLPQSLLVVESGDGLYTVSGWELGDQTLSVHDAAGRCIQRIGIGANQRSATINLAHAAPGVYVVRSEGASPRMARIGRW